MPGRSENDPLTDSSVTVLRRCVINPSEKENYDDVFLGPLDLAFTAVPTNVITVYLNKDTSTVRGIIDANMFKAAYARALDYYPVLSGRLDENPNTGRRWIRSVGVAGAEFIEATCAKRLDQIAAANKSGRVFVSQLPGGSNALLCDFVPFDKEFVYKNALMSVQLTTFACGGVTLGYHVMHAVCDGTGTFNFIRDVAELYRKLCRALDSANPDSLSPEYLSDFCKQISLNDPTAD
ncbi:Transferase family, putative [Angomonas deanei]|uniref:Transferase family, putative n=1 Tax=Angomonas deanei TaxID=59799 RepID=A0A7G2C8S2_9TRYP|nr:Transferase family, putative [Angomonas deanei]